MSADPTTPPRSAPGAQEAALRTALASTPRPPRPSALSASLTFGWRGMLKVKHVPEQLLDVTITPVMLRSPNAVMHAGFMGIFPLTFLSNVFVDPETLPAGLEAFVEVNPISILATDSRGLMDGTAEAGDIAVVLATAALLTAVFAPLTTRLYRGKG